LGTVPIRQYKRARLRSVVFSFAFFLRIFFRILAFFAPSLREQLVSRSLLS
jgi:hypothetical protein